MHTLSATYFEAKSENMSLSESNECEKCDNFQFNKLHFVKQKYSCEINLHKINLGDVLREKSIWLFAHQPNNVLTSSADRPSTISAFHYLYVISTVTFLSNFSH